MSIALGKMALNQNDLAGSLCRESFYDFVLYFWKILDQQPFQNNWHVKYLCDELQKMAERVVRNQPKEYDLIINISPGSTKSTIVSIMLPAWLWTRMPSASVIGASHTENLATDLSRKNRMVVKSEHYRACFPYIKVPMEQDAKGYFINTKNGMRFSCGLKGDVMGRHGNMILIDDPIDPEQATSEMDVERANFNVKEKLATRERVPGVTPFVVIMQRLAENDTTGMMLREWPFPIKHVCLPAELTNGVKPKELKEFYQDGLMFPNRHSREFLDAKKGGGEAFYAGQYLQSPVPRGGLMFHVDRFKVESVVPTKWKIRMRYWDKAATEGAGMHTVGVLMGKDMDDRFWVLDVVRGQWNTSHREAVIKQTAEADGHGVLVGVEQEPGSSGKDSAEYTVRNLAGYRVRVDRPTGDKVQRADPYSVQVNNGNVALLRGTWNHDYVEEFRYFSENNTKGKDQVDASSGAFKYVAKPVFRAGGFRL